DRADDEDRIQVAAGIYTETLTITKRLVIQGANHRTVSIDGSANPGSSVVTVAPGASVSLSGLTIRNGHASVGGGMRNAGVVSLASVVIQNNSSDDGGGIYNQGILGAYYSAVISNTATHNGGAIYNDTSQALGMLVSTISGNSAGAAGGGLFNAGG